MKKIIIGSFLTAALIISGSVNVKAQSKSEVKVIKKEVVKNEVLIKKAVQTKNTNTTEDKVLIKRSAVNSKDKVVTKEVVKDQMKKQPAKLNGEKK